MTAEIEHKMDCDHGWLLTKLYCSCGVERKFLKWSYEEQQLWKDGHLLDNGQVAGG